MTTRGGKTRRRGGKTRRMSRDEMRRSETRRSRRGETRRSRRGETRRSRRKDETREGVKPCREGGNNEKEVDTDKGGSRRGGNEATPQHGVTPSSRAGWLCFHLLFLFLNYIPCMWAQT